VTCECGRDNRADARFCDACGAPLKHASVVGERRRVTAFSCDVVGYAELTEQLDGEDLQRLIQSYQGLVERTVTRWAGDIDCYTGDGVDAFFGLTAHDNDAESAVRAALGIIAGLEAMRVPALRSGDLLPHLRVRIGIHTGPVVVGAQGTTSGGRKQALGPAMNGAARLQSLAAPGTVIISESTHRLVADLFACTDLGEKALKGIKRPIRAFAVVRQTGHGWQGQRDQRTPLIGRERELRQLLDCWRLARSGRRTTVMLSGEPGIGKSRLVRALVESAGIQAGAGFFEWRCSPFHADTPFYPMVEALQRYLGNEPSTPRDEVAVRIRAYVAATNPRLDDAAIDDATALLSELVSPSETSGHSGEETPPVRRARTLTLIRDLARAQVLLRPSLLIVEDIHWADPSTIEVITQLKELEADLALLLVLTLRTDDGGDGESPAPWDQWDEVRRLKLKRLNKRQSAKLFDALFGERSISDDLRKTVLSRFTGVPLFLEEVTRDLAEAKGPTIEAVALAIPHRVEVLFRKRIDRLSSSARDTIRLASVLSRDFSFDLLASVGNKSRSALRDDLRTLRAARLVMTRRVVRRKGDVGETYNFSHALVADAAYEGILPHERRRLHLQIAQRLAELFPTIAQERPEVLARHFEEADSPGEAIEYWQRAGDRAIDRGAYQEAVSHLDHALALIPGLSPDERRRDKQIEITESKGTALFSKLGYAHPAVEENFAQASALCEQSGTTPPLRVLYGIWAVHMTRSNREAIEALLPRFFEIASADGSSIARHTARASAGIVAFFSGQFTQCLEDMTGAVSQYAEVGHSVQWHGYGGGMYPFAYRMWSLTILGSMDAAAAARDDLQRLARKAGNPYGIAIADGFCANVARDCRDVADALALAERQIDYTRRQILPFWEGPAHCTRGWARASIGHVEDGIAEIRLGLQYLDAVGLRTTYPYQLGGLAEALLIAGDLAGAKEAAEQGLAISQVALDRFYEAELLRLRAEASRRLGDAVAAESGFRTALALATKQQATLFALRAAEDLGRWLVECGRADEARQTLEAVLSTVPAARRLYADSDTRDSRGQIA
jgi:class 3 adenylate cyclase/tetratricopeptide (TPR) repeat protein